MICAAPIRPPAGSLEEFYQTRFRPIRLLGCRPATFEAYRSALNHWARWERRATQRVPGEEIVPLARIDSEALARFGGYCLTLHGPVTCNKHVRHLMGILRFAVKERRLASLPEWKKLREPLRAPLAFTTEEFSRILSAAGKVTGAVGTVPAALWWRAILLTIWYTGARIRALLAVPLSDLDWTAGGLYLRSEEQKDHADQFLDLGEDALEAIRAMRSEACPLTSLLFAWPYASPQPARKRFKRICAAAGVPLRNDTGSKFHRIRKSTASYLKLNGGDATGRLGHSTPKVTERYFDPRILGESRQARFMPRP